VQQACTSRTARTTGATSRPCEITLRT
jgi:hypothetical protein